MNPSGSTLPPNTPREKAIVSVLHDVGLKNLAKICNTLQGSVWSANKKNGECVVIKVTSKKLHQQRSSMLIEGATKNNRKYFVHENITKEKEILKYLTANKNAPQSIIKYIGFFKSNINYYLLMENGGVGLFDFVVRAHKLIQCGRLEIVEWQKCVKIIFKQMIEAVEYIHSKHICHFDISLENFVINDVNICVDENTGKINFCDDNIHVKLCDFGLAERFKPTASFSSNKYCGKESYKSPEVHQKNGSFDAKANDIWCLGVCLFMMTVGSCPWKKADVDSDEIFNGIIQDTDKSGVPLIKLIDHWDRLNYVDFDVINLFTSIFQVEQRRISLKEIKNHLWLN